CPALTGVFRGNTHRTPESFSDRIRRCTDLKTSSADDLVEIQGSDLRRFGDPLQTSLRRPGTARPQQPVYPRVFAPPRFSAPGSVDRTPSTESLERRGSSAMPESFLQETLQRDRPQT